ncbi:unnamed protein product [Brachionus calyciflorus]|uniref:GB1/RHD3-type G domain-containing protein n=1 Tax=Brachionus calyciflorus TaxID=104777 RepID=A0A814EGK2_9BILA|nr:unnamed protein product [Brachionus calyciflorus]
MSFSYFLNTPRPLKIVELDKNHKFILNDKNLKSILFHRKARNKPVCIISIAGAFRKGKSFLLNFFIRFFKNGGREGWLENESDLLKGFHWRGGSDRDTTGIFMWSEPFLLRTVRNEEVAVLLMDTQGSFDSSTTMKDCASLFALSLMISSMQIYNISQNIQEDDLQNLQLFSDYGRLALESTSMTAFQTLIFLVRDWSYSYEYEYGFKGGFEFLMKRLNISSSYDLELKDTRNFIKNCFKDIKCFLMPHPGLKASTNPYFEGRLNDIDPLFRIQVVNFIEGLFQEKLFQIKEINGEQITTTELFEYFKIYCEAFQDNQLPNPKSLLKVIIYLFYLNKGPTLGHLPMRP